MVRKPFDVEIPEGTHLASTRDSDGALRATLRDDRDNKLVGHAELFERDESAELFERDESAQIFELEESSNEEDSDDSDLGGVLAGLALIGLTAAAVAAARGILSKRKSSRDSEEQNSAQQPRDATLTSQTQSQRVSPPPGWYSISTGQLRWWDGHTWTDHYHPGIQNRIAPAGWYNDGSGRLRWFDGHQWTSYYTANQQQMERQPAPANPTRGTPQAPVSDIIHRQAIISMTSDEWQERFRAMLLARAFSEEQWTLLAHAQIVDGSQRLMQWQRELATLSPQDFLERIHLTLGAATPGHSHVLTTPQTGLNDGRSSNHQWRAEQTSSGQHQYEMKANLSNNHYQRRVPPGWYNDGSGRTRWWDGHRWTNNWTT